MPSHTNSLIESFAAKLKDCGLPLQEENNASRLDSFNRNLPRRLHQSFESFLSLYSFPSFEIAGIALFGWQSDDSSFIQEAAAAKGSLSELLVPAGYVQIGRPHTGSFDAVCFNVNDRKQNRECPIVQVDHEEILCNWRVKVSGELFPSFVALVETFLSATSVGIRWEH